MNKKLNITAAEYQYKIRQQAKARTERFRKEQEKRGYKNITVYLSGPFRDELKKLSDEKGLNRQAAMDHIFEVYQQTVIGCVTSNVMSDKGKTAEIPVNAEPDGKPTEKPIVETQTEIPAPTPDKARIIERMAKYRAAGDLWQTVADKLNDQGILTARGETWTKANAQAFYSRNKEA